MYFSLRMHFLEVVTDLLLEIEIKLIYYKRNKEEILTNF